MSITEAAAIKAVEDGLAGRNVPIVHEEIRVVLAMALRAETAERDLDTARGLIARLGDADALESLNALLTLERANHLSARARVVELERERDEARALWDDALRQVLHHSNARGRAEADAARLREALERELPDEARPYSLESADAAHYAREVSRCARVNEQRNRILAALASAPSAEPTPRDMRVAEAVREACAEQVMRTIVFDAIDVVRPGWHEQKATAARIVRDLDLAAVVAKALEVGT